MVTPARIHASDAAVPDKTDAPAAQAPAVQPAPQPAAFHEQYDLGAISGERVIALRGAGASQNFFFDMPLTKIISGATLELHYAAPLQRSNESRLELWLNGTRVGSVPIVPGYGSQNETPFPTDLLTKLTRLTSQLQRICTASRP